jgi:hypothetical protein
MRVFDLSASQLTPRCVLRVVARIAGAASPQRQLHARLALTVPLILLLAGCLTTPRPSTTALIDALPSQVDGIELGTVNRIDDSFMSGHPLDDALARLSLDRTAASAVFRGAADGRLEVGAVAVEGAGGPIWTRTPRSLPLLTGALTLGRDRRARSANSNVGSQGPPSGSGSRGPSSWTTCGRRTRTVTGRSPRPKAVG